MNMISFVMRNKKVTIAMVSLAACGALFTYYYYKSFDACDEISTSANVDRRNLVENKVCQKTKKCEYPQMLRKTRFSRFR